MKTFLSVLAGLLAYASSYAQNTNACDILSINTEFVSSSPSTQFPGKCDVRINLSWEQVANNGNKFSFFHIWPAATYQPFNYNSTSTPPSAADLAKTLGTIIVKDPSSSTPTLYFQYKPDLSYTKVLPLAGYTTPTLRRTTQNNIDRFTVENVVLAGLDCAANGIYQFVGDVWASQQSQGNNVQCVVQNNSFSVNQVVDRTLISCSSGLQVQLLSSVAATTGTVKVYADAQSAGSFDPNGDVLISSQSFATSNTAVVSGSWPYRYAAQMSVPAAYAKSNFWVQVIPDGGKAMQAFSVSNSCATLPVTLANFTAARKSGIVALSWQTLTEQNTKGFNVQRNTGSNWETIAFVPSSTGGNSSNPAWYAYTDANSGNGTVQYRLAEVSTDGRQQLSEVRVVNGEHAAGKVLLYPNPTDNGRATLVFETAATRDIAVTDLSGRTVKAFSNTTANNVVLEILQAGFYTIRITDKNTNLTTTEKLIVNKH